MTSPSRRAVEWKKSGEWKATFRALGFSEVAAHSYTRMTASTMDGRYEAPQAPERGTVALEEHIRSVFWDRMIASGQ